MGQASDLGADMLLRIAQAAISVPAYPRESLQTAWHADGKDAPIPPLSRPAREAVFHAKSAVSMYRAACVVEKTPESLELYKLWYHQCGCLILEHEFTSARAELELLSKALHPQGSSSPSLLALNIDVLGTLQWISHIFNDTQAAKRYEKWRHNTRTQL